MQNCSLGVNSIQSVNKSRLSCLNSLKCLQTLYSHFYYSPDTVYMLYCSSLCHLSLTLCPFLRVLVVFYSKISRCSDCTDQQVCVFQAACIIQQSSTLAVTHGTPIQLEGLTEDHGRL